MILGVAPAVASGGTAASTALSAANAPSVGSALSAASVSAGPPGASAGGGQGNAAAAAAADPDAALILGASHAPGAGTSGAEFAAQFAALTDGSASRTDGGDAQGTVAPSVQALSELVRGLAPSAAPVSAVEQTIAPAVGSAAWPGAVAAQVHWIASSGVTSATLNLSPEHLGPIQVFIDQQASQVNVSFSAAHADTRAALEQALPKLREMFAAGGLALGQATVQQEARSGSQSAAAARVTRVSDTTEAASPLPATQALGLVDEYA
jgi:flagellar hook-length control protein FliK